MKTPFVASLPSILVLNPRPQVFAACKTAGASLGMPVRLAVDEQAATRLVHDTRPLVLVRDVEQTLPAAAVVERLATSIDAGVVHMDGTEASEVVRATLQKACFDAEKRRHSSPA